MLTLAEQPGVQTGLKKLTLGEITLLWVFFFSGLSSALAVAAIILSEGLLIPFIATGGLVAQIFGTQKCIQRDRQLINQTVEVGL